MDVGAGNDSNHSAGTFEDGAETKSDGNTKKLDKLLDRLYSSANGSREQSPDNSKTKEKSSGSSRRKPKVTRKVVEDEKPAPTVQIETSVDAFETNSFDYIDSLLGAAKAPSPAPETEPSEVLCDISKSESSKDNESSSRPVKASKDKQDAPAAAAEDFVIPEGTVVVHPEAVEEKRPIFKGPEWKQTKKTSRGDALGILLCTACNKQIPTNKEGSARIHPVLKVLICKKCYNWYTSAAIEQDADGMDEQCRWCGEGGNLVCCDYCHNAFCQACIKRNLGRKEISEIMNAGDDVKWKCYVCDPKPMANLIQEAHNIINEIQLSFTDVKNKDQPKKTHRSSKPVVIDDSPAKTPPNFKQTARKSTTPQKNVGKALQIQNIVQNVHANMTQNLPVISNVQGGVSVLIPPQGKQRNPNLQGRVIGQAKTVVNSRQQQQQARTNANPTVNWEVNINEINVCQVLDRTLAATESMRMVLTSFKDELKKGQRSGGNSLLTAKRDVSRKLKRAMGAFKKQIQDIELFTQTFPNPGGIRSSPNVGKVIPNVKKTVKSPQKSGDVVVILSDSDDESDKEQSSKGSSSKKVDEEKNEKETNKASNNVEKTQHASEAEKENTDGVESEKKAADNSNSSAKENCTEDPDKENTANETEKEETSDDSSTKPKKMETNDTEKEKNIHEDSNEKSKSDGSNTATEISDEEMDTSVDKEILDKSKDKDKLDKNDESLDEQQVDKSDTKSLTGNTDLADDIKSSDVTDELVMKSSGECSENEQANESGLSDKVTTAEFEDILSEVTATITNQNEDSGDAGDIEKKAKSSPDKNSDSNRKRRNSETDQDVGERKKRILSSSPKEVESASDEDNESEVCGDAPANMSEHEESVPHAIKGESLSFHEEMKKLMGKCDDSESENEDNASDNPDEAESHDVSDGEAGKCDDSESEDKDNHASDNPDKTESHDVSDGEAGKCDDSESENEDNHASDNPDKAESHAGSDDETSNGDKVRYIDESSTDIQDNTEGNKEKSRDKRSCLDVKVVLTKIECDIQDDTEGNNEKSRDKTSCLDVKVVLPKIESRYKNILANRSVIVKDKKIKRKDVRQKENDEKLKHKAKGERNLSCDESDSCDSGKESKSSKKTDKKLAKTKTIYMSTPDDSDISDFEFNKTKKKKKPKSKIKKNNSDSSDVNLNLELKDIKKRRKKSKSKQSQRDLSLSDSEADVKNNKKREKKISKSKIKKNNSDSSDDNLNLEFKDIKKRRKKSKSKQNQQDLSLSDSEADVKNNKKREKKISKNKDKSETKKKEVKRSTSSDSSEIDDLEKEILKLKKLPTLGLGRSSEKNGTSSDSSDDGDKVDKKILSPKQLKKIEEQKTIGKPGYKKKSRKSLIDDLSSGKDEEENVDADVEEPMISETNGVADHLSGGEKSDENERARKALLADESSDDDTSDMEIDIEKKTKTQANDDDDDDDKSKSSEGTSKKKGSRASKKQVTNSLLKSKLDDSSSDSDFTSKGGKKRKRKHSDSDVSLKDLENLSLESGSDSDIDTPTKNKSKKKKDSSESDNSDSDMDSDAKEKKKKAKKRRKRIKKMSDMSGSEGGSDEEGSGSEDGEHGKSKGRKNIRKIIKEKNLSKQVKSALKAEEERRKRIEERQKLYNQIQEEVDEESPLKNKKTTKLVLDVDSDKKPLIEVHPKLIKKLKPHQVEAVKFLWDSTVESLSRLKKDAGGGCILAHCMGLGKTLSVITFVHTMLFNDDVTGTRTALVVCPLNTVLNWQREWQHWLDEDEQLSVYELSNVKNNPARADALKDWKERGGIMIMGYEMYRNLVLQKNVKNKRQKKIFTESLVDPGPDLVICDEGHILKNSQSSLSKAMSMIKTRRRVVLTGTPLQNNLVEYHCMVDFVKPNLLGTKKEFTNRFVNPILNGQHRDSSQYDVKIMKKRAHILHEHLAGCVQRKDYTELTKVLMPKHEYVLSVRLSKVQQDLYDRYLQRLGDMPKGRGGQLFSDYQALMRIWTHPWVLKLDEIRQENKRSLKDDEDEFIDDEYDSEDSFVNDDSSDNQSKSEASLSDGSEGYFRKHKRKAGSRRSQRRGEDNSEESDSSTKKGEVVKKWKSKRRNGSDTNEASDDSVKVQDVVSNEWWGDFVKDEDKYKHELSGKLILLAEVLRMCENIGDKILVFSQSLLSLDLIESFLELWDEEKDPEKRVAGQHKWFKNMDYFRMDGSTSAQYRQQWCSEFNDLENYRARLFLISTKAGSLGTNLVAANRVIIFDASWNPSHDVQSIFRVYRFGQTKPCYIYRFLAQGTMEEKIYERQVTKQSLSQRVVDEHQIDRHFTANDLQELYNFQPLRWTDENVEREMPVLPKDRMLAELLTDKKDWIVKYHEHDSLLENKVDEDLTEDERKKAWEEYEAEKKGIYTAARNTYSSLRQNQNPMASNTHQQWLDYYGVTQQQQQQQQYQQQAAQQAPMSLQSIEQVARSIFAANPGISQGQLQLKVQNYIEMVNAQQQMWYRQQQEERMAAESQRRMLEAYRNSAGASTSAANTLVNMLTSQPKPSTQKK